MSERKASIEAELVQSSPGSTWDQFWFAEGSVLAAARIRALLCVAAALYFVGCAADVSGWLTGSTPFSGDNVAAFFYTSGLESEARWSLSPLFLLDAISGGTGLIYYLYLVVAIILCGLVAWGRGGYVATWLLWILFAGWANRLMFLSGVAEPLLSFGLFAAAIAPPASAFQRHTPDFSRGDWRAGFSLRLMAVQVTLFSLATVGTMLAGRVWWTGYGAYALIAPAQDRTLSLDSFLSETIICDSLTHLLVLALPVGLFIAWLRPRSWLGPIVIGLWCAIVAALGSHWLYGLTLACLALSIHAARRGGPATTASEIGLDESAGGQ